MGHSFISIPILCLVLLVPFSASVPAGLGNGRTIIGQAKCGDDSGREEEVPVPTPKQVTQKSWCIPKPSASYQQLIENMSYACNLVNCSAVHSETGACYYPNSLINHAAFAMNLYYQTAGGNKWNCDFNNSAVIGVTDPSYGGCNFECSF